MPRKPKTWSWTTGTHGATVRAFERVPGGALYLGVPRAGGGYRRVKLKHRDRDLAQQQAQELAARRMRETEQQRDGPLTLAKLFAIYLTAAEPKQSPRHHQKTARSVEAWLRYLGPGYPIERFGAREWDTFTALRASGELDPRGQTVSDPEQRQPVGPRIIAADLQVLRAAIRRAMIERVPGGGAVLDRDPTLGLSLPVERNPRRPVYDAARVTALLAASDRIKMRVGHGRAARYEPSYLRTLITLASDTGRRISAILALRWSDWLPDQGTHGTIRWRAETDKLRRESRVPVTPAVREALEQHRRTRPGVGDVLLFPRPNDPTKPLTDSRALRWLRRAEKLAGLEPLPGGAWHPFRRRWASERKHHSLKDTAEAGGWVDTATLLRCYQTADPETMEAVVMGSKPLRLLG